MEEIQNSKVESYEYASIGLRFAAHLLDGIILSILSFVLQFVYSLFTISDELYDKILILEQNPESVSEEFAVEIFWELMPIISFFILLLVIMCYLYYAIFQSSKLQATPGKLACSIKVTNVNGERIGFGRATGRFFSKSFISSPIFMIGYIIAFFTAKKQSLHDLIAGTLVLRK
ncbi:RDD family protein [Bacillus carboniphilus]|uniref:RDD family protein n=1 Tax=Bacillus carboniphilus TaxID=86663 RepID=A0ABY9JUW2_9BACI|nr:RDD family protein [Bacillus carboniphilus]WLR43181.1 RDD family protein [Bacillus carboniphilus]